VEYGLVSCPVPHHNALVPPHKQDKGHAN
jgi:hypothetical protein